MVVVFGTVCIDRVRRVPTLPPKGGYVEIESETILLGGEAANTASHLHAWGIETVLCGNSLGGDVDGLLLREQVRAAGLDDQYLDRTGVAPVCDIYVTPDGDRTMVGKGFSAMDPYVDVEKIPFQSGAWFTAEPNMPNASRLAVKTAYEKGMSIYLMDFIREEEFIPDGAIWQTSTDWFGKRSDREANFRALAGLTKKYGCRALLTDGAQGVYVGEGGLVEHRPVIKEIEPVDSTGAGDAFRAGVLAGLSRHLSFDRAISMGQAAGAEACLKLGAAAGQVSFPEV